MIAAAVQAGETGVAAENACSARSDAAAQAGGGAEGLENTCGMLTDAATVKAGGVEWGMEKTPAMADCFSPEGTRDAG
eukprot:CAMPEP_0175511704 /NCGR_PEP_ID=MMETSP0096-20121207/12034_1 /TAXON_ID=311494 /ORGANISM="Alexandrium monilatum, Strain CCMP3105" /LENGTH=77 /DNA_ID=CAMNT_0016813905 /DNA_START=129 /DNA_END=363 /DNA_ORIENTATION=-